MPAHQTKIPLTLPADLGVGALIFADVVSLEHEIPVLDEDLVPSSSAEESQAIGKTRHPPVDLFLNIDVTTRILDRFGK